jgi:hypothetical protein
MSSVQDYVSAIGNGMETLSMSNVQQAGGLSPENPNGNFVAGEPKFVPTGMQSTPQNPFRP